jgi:hypothetical protein
MEKNFNFKKTFLITMIISLSISALIGIFVFLFGEFGETEAKILLTTLSIGGFSLTGLCCSVLYEKKKYIGFSFLGMALSILGFLTSILVIWEFVNIFEGWFNITGWGKLTLALIILAFSSAHSCLLLLINPEKSPVKYALFATLLFIGIVTLMLVLLIFEIINNPGEFYFRLLGVFAILNVLGTIVTPILNKIYSLQQ